MDCLAVLKPGAFGAVFSSVRLMHRMMVNLEDSGFIIKDVLFWSYLNGMPKSRDVALDIDKELGVKVKKQVPINMCRDIKNMELKIIKQEKRNTF
jgi:site-specific DNA-methyltransferase (adenine-specific)